MMRAAVRIGLTAAVMALLLAPAPGRGELGPELKKQLETSTYVYISSTRKDGNLGAPAEIWFMYRDGAVYVGTSPDSWRVRRIKAGRPAAKIAIGKPAGPSFTATGAVVSDPAAQAAMMEVYAKKYPEGWPRYAEKFRSGFKDGSRVLVKYVPQ